MSRKRSRYEQALVFNADGEENSSSDEEQSDEQEDPDQQQQKRIHIAIGKGSKGVVCHVSVFRCSWYLLKVAEAYELCYSLAVTPQLCTGGCQPGSCTVFPGPGALCGVLLHGLLQVCGKSGHKAGFVGSVYMDCPNKPCYLCKQPGDESPQPQFMSMG
jgi:DNA damage-binding protein 2